MKKDFIYTHIRKICLLSSMLSTIAFVILIIIYIKIPFSDIFYPNTLSYPSSADTVYKSGTEYVKITLNDVKYTGYDCYKRGKVYGSYYYSLVNNSCTFILIERNSNSKPPEVLNNYSISARLVKRNKLADSMGKSFAKDMGWTTEGLQKISSSVILDETEYHVNVFYYLITFLWVMFLILASFLLLNTFYLIFPKFFPACLYFKKLSDDNRELIHVDYELSSHVILKAGNIILTEHYLVATSLFNIEIIPMNKIIWAYEHSTWQNIFLAKTKLTYTLNIICERKFHAYSPRNTKNDIDNIISYLKDNYPNIIIGYSNENKVAALKKAKKKRHSK